MVHQKADGIAIFAAAKAVVELFGRAHRKGWRLFPMERAQAHEVGAPLLELHVAAHDLHNIGTGDELLDEGLGDGHGGIVGRAGYRLAGCLYHMLSNI